MQSCAPPSRVCPTRSAYRWCCFHYEERSYQQIAEDLGISVAKVKTDILRGPHRAVETVAGEQPMAHEPGNDVEGALAERASRMLSGTARFQAPANLEAQVWNVIERGGQRAVVEANG